MQQPRIAGFTRDSRAYEVIARAAAQDVTNPDLLELQDINAKMEMQSKTSVDVTAGDGVYDSKSGMLTSAARIVVKSTAGYTGLLSEAVIDVHKNNVVSEKPVRVKMLQGNVDSNRLEVGDSGELLLFGGGVTMVLNHQPKPVLVPEKAPHGCLQVCAPPASCTGSQGQAAQPVAATRSAAAK